MTEAIKYYNRQAKQFETEKVYGDALIKLLYGTIPGRTFSDFLCRRPLSQIYGIYQSSGLSKRKIAAFIRDFNIPMEEYDEGSGFKSFNDFFIRKFRPGKREFVSTPHRMAAFAEARYLGFEKTTLEQTYPVKGKELTSEALLKSSKWATVFNEGPLLIARLCPVDYHRFHFPDEGEIQEFYKVPGFFHSVNPVALKHKDTVFSQNERHITILNTKNFGKLAYIEVGAMCVGKIVQTHSTQGSFKRGEEKGLFLFGGSTVIVMGEKGAWLPSPDILEYSRQKIETYIKLGDAVAEKKGATHH